MTLPWWWGEIRLAEPRDIAAHPLLTGGPRHPFALGPTLRTDARNLLLLGFGTGFSWGGAAITCGPLVIPDLVRVDAPAAESE